MQIAILSMKEIEVRGQGIPRYIKELYENLKVLEKTEDINVRKFYFPYNKFLGDEFSFEIGSFFYKIPSKIELIHIPNGFFIAHRLPEKVKVVSTIHDVNPIPPKVGNLKYFIKDRLWRYFVFKRGIKYNLKISDAIIANSTQTRNEVINLGVDKSKVFVVNLGIDKRFLSNGNKKVKKTDYKKFIVGYIGSFATNKNINFILSTAKQLENNNINFQLWGGKTYDYRNLVKRALGLKNVRFMGFAPENELVKTYDSFDVFVFPSLYEGFGLPILEAQARGLPVIIYKYGKIPKEVRKYCFEAEDSEHMAQIIMQLKENGYNEKLRKKATTYARSFTWEKTARETLEVYKKVLRE
jgi:glycosyltransferase involved in cell wall biosynthesis